MKKVIVSERKTDEIFLEEVKEKTPIFAFDKKGDRWDGMVTREIGKGWTVRDTLGLGSSGHYETREQCLQYDSKYYDFYIFD